MGAITKLEIYGVVALVLALAIGGAYFKGHHSGYVEGRDEVQAQFDAFKNKVEAAGLKAQQDNLDKEKLYATNIATANASRADALTRLQLAQAAARSGGSILPSRPAGSSGGDKICFTRTGLDQALQRFIGATAGIAQEGDVAIIDSATLLRAWPSQVK